MDVAGVVDAVAALAVEGMQISAANALWVFADEDAANRDAIRGAGGIPPLVAMIESGSSSAGVRLHATGALGSIAYDNTENKVVIREAGGLRALVALVEGRSVNVKAIAARTLRRLSHNNDENAVAIALARGRVEAIVELARRGSVTVLRARGRVETIVELAQRGSVTVDAKVVVENAGAAAKRKAALVVARLFRDCVDSAIPYDIKTAIASYLTSPDPVRKLI